MIRKVGLLEFNWAGQIIAHDDDDDDDDDDDYIIIILLLSSLYELSGWNSNTTKNQCKNFITLYFGGWSKKHSYNNAYVQVFSPE
jgi:hypothetical protein